jgi:hypothetical protein
MNDSQKWLEAAAGIEEDIEYLTHSLNAQDLAALQVALSVYVKNAATGVAWPKPDDLYCIYADGFGLQVRVEMGTREDHKIAC